MTAIEKVENLYQALFWLAATASNPKCCHTSSATSLTGCGVSLYLSQEI
jgi:hypothetical protein